MRVKVHLKLVLLEFPCTWWATINPAYSSLWTAGQLPNEISGKIRGLPEGLVTQVGVPLGHGRAFVSQELLQGIKVLLV